MRFFTPDSLHINEKNFKSLLSFIKDGKHLLIQNTENKNLIAKFGDYSDIENEEISSIRKDLYLLNSNDLFDESEFGINLFQTSKAEILSFALADESYAFADIRSNKDVFEYLRENYFEVLINNLAVARFWLRFWKVFFQKNRFDIALIFSGSLIYQRSAIELLKFHTARVYILETYLTGNDFYIEERYSPIAGDSLLKYKNYYSKLDVPETTHNYMKAINKYLMGQNLNVKQPEPSNIQLFNNNQNTILIIGQVVNDFSLIENGIYSIDLYIDLISKIISETDYNIIFKAHPWEHRKANLKKPFTLNKLTTVFEPNERLKYVDNFNIGELFKMASHVIVINSQSGIDAAWNGIRPIVLTQAFYSGKGFTTDLSDVDAVIRYIQNVDHSVMTLSEFKLFEQYLIRSFLGHFVSKFPSGKLTLSKIFNFEKQIPLYHKEEITIKSSEQKKENKSVPVTLIKKTAQSLDCIGLKKEKESKLVKKLKKTPVLYCLDSKYLLLRVFGKALRRCHEIFSN